MEIFLVKINRPTHLTEVRMTNNNLKKFIVIGVVATMSSSILALTSVKSAVAATDDTVLAKSSAYTVTYGDVKKRIKVATNIDDTQKAAILKNAAQLKQLSLDILRSKLLIDEAKAKKLAAKPEVMEKIDASTNDILSTSAIEAAVPITAIAASSDTEVRDYYEKFKSKMKVGKRVDISIIVVSSPADADPAFQKSQKAKIDELYKDLKASGGDKAVFAKTARIGSEDPSTRDKGGNVAGGLIALDELSVPELKSAIESLKVNEISAPILIAGSGWYVVRLNDMKPGGTPGFDEMKERIATQVKNDKLNEARQTYIEGLMTKANGTADDSAINKVLQ